MDIIIKKKRWLSCFIMFLTLVSLICSYSYLYAQEKPEQQSEQSAKENLERVKNLLDEGLDCLKEGAINKAKVKFEEALEIAPEEMKGEIKNLIAQVDDVNVKTEELAKDAVIKSEEEAKKMSELQQNIIQFEKEQKKLAYLTQGKRYFDQGEYEKALAEFNMVLALIPQDEDAVSWIGKTDLAIEKDKQTQAKRIQECWRNAKTYERDKKYDSAINELEKIIAVEPTNADALEYLEEMKLLKAEMDEYKGLENLVERGRGYFQDKEYDKALQLWERVLEENPNHPGIETLIAQAKFYKSREEIDIVEDKYKAEREERMLEIDSAYVPVLGGETKQKQSQTVEDEDTLAIEAIKEAIKQKKVTLEFTDADLRSVIMFLSRQSGVNMMVDEAIFQAEAAAAAAAPGGTGAAAAAAAQLVSTYNVTASLRDISLADALSLILRSRGLDYEIYPNVIWISSNERIANVPMEKLETRIFDLQFGGPVRGQLRPEPLVLETITFGEESSGD